MSTDRPVPELDAPPAVPVAADAASGTLPPERVQAMFNRIARPYDLMNRAMTVGLDRKWRALAADTTGVGAGASVVDVCCGTADLSLELARRVGPSGEVIGVDFAEQMLVRGREKATEGGYSQVTLLQGDALALPFDDDRFAAATCAFGVRNLADPERGFRELARASCGPAAPSSASRSRRRRAAPSRASTASGSIASCRPSGASSTGAATRPTRTCQRPCAASRRPPSSAA